MHAKVTQLGVGLSLSSIDMYCVVVGVYPYEEHEFHAVDWYEDTRTRCRCRRHPGVDCWWRYVASYQVNNMDILFERWVYGPHYCRIGQI